MSAPIIEVQNVSKRYQLGGAKPRDFWALQDVSFTVNQGDVVGIVGRNGAGKSTLLKILSRITEPTGGRAILRGRVASLLEVGTGFHPDLSGRENIFLNGAILGMKRAEIARKFDEIVAFSEIESFIDTPVKRYSSGMYVRLAFAVAAHLEPEILVVDEVLAVGDAEFQRKCLGKMQEVSRGRGRTVLFVSHNMAAVQSLCTRGVLLASGKVVCTGETGEILSRYSQQNLAATDAWNRPSHAAPRPLQFESVQIRVDGSDSQRRLVVDIVMASTEPHRPAFVAIDILNSYGTSVMQALPSVTPFIGDEPKRHEVQVAVELPALIPGYYSLTLWTGPHNIHTYDSVESAVGFDIETSPTPGRTFGHTPDHGFIVPHSTVRYGNGTNAN
jgi:lipopolysaccharide transport system ATP-binding protein